MSKNPATVTSKGRVTIPKSVRDSLGIAVNDRLLFIIEENWASLIPIRRDSLADLYKALPATRPYPGMPTIREDIRNEIEDYRGQGEV
jgi:AbrB family looped-hinge helix DNA binding protein